MHENLKLAQAQLGTNLTNLERADKNSTKLITDAKSIAITHLQKNAIIQDPSELLPLGLVAFGSLARREVSDSESDFDYAVVAYQTVETPEHILEYQRAADDVCRQALLKRPGSSGIFGGLISSTELINKIGLDDDTNRSHTQRMLFLEESVPIIGESEHQATVRAILRRYLVDYREKDLTKKGVPRFLVNDIVRYWRTIAVDYQAKRWDEPSAFINEGTSSSNPKWGMRYIKLRSSRKLAFCGSLASTFIPYLENTEVNDDVLFEQFSMPPLARIAQLLSYLQHDEDKEQLKTILNEADWFAGKFNEPEFRNRLGEVQHPRRETNDVFREAFAHTETLQSALERLFLSTNTLTLPNGAGELHGTESDESASFYKLAARYLIF